MPTSAEGFGLCPRLFLPFAHKSAYYAVLAHFFFANFWCPVVTLLTFSSSLSNFERNPTKKQKNLKKIQKKLKKKKIKKNSKNHENVKKKNPKIFIKIFKKSTTKKIHKNLKNKNNVTHCQKWSKNLKISKNLKKIYFFQTQKFCSKKTKLQKEKKCFSHSFPT